MKISDNNVEPTRNIPREIIQEEMRQRFGDDKSMFIYEVIQYEVKGDSGYIVYLDNELCVDYRENGNWPHVGQSGIYHKLKFLENLPDNHFTAEQRLAFRRQLAEALVAQYDSQTELANSLLDTAKSFHDDCLQKKISVCSFFSGTIIFIIMSVLSLILYLLAKYDIWGLWDHWELLRMGIWICIGSYLSFVTKGWKKISNVQTLPNDVYLMTIGRFVYGLCCGCAIYVLIGCNKLCPMVISDMSSTTLGKKCIMILAGFADFLAPFWLDAFAEAYKKLLLVFEKIQLQPKKEVKAVSVQSEPKE